MCCVQGVLWVKLEGAITDDKADVGTIFHFALYVPPFLFPSLSTVAATPSIATVANIRPVPSSIPHIVLMLCQLRDQACGAEQGRP